MRYIDPYQLADKVAESMRDNPHEGKLALNHRLEHEHFLRMIALAPDADVEPVVYAHWIYKPYEGEGDLWLYHCSACANLSTRPRAYCAECGAKMKVKVEHYKGEE